MCRTRAKAGKSVSLARGSLRSTSSAGCFQRKGKGPPGRMLCSHPLKKKQNFLVQGPTQPPTATTACLRNGIAVTGRVFVCICGNSTGPELGSIIFQQHNLRMSTKYISFLLYRLHRVWKIRAYTISRKGNCGNIKIIIYDRPTN